MLDFRPNEDQQLLVESIARFASERVRKVYRSAEEEREISETIIRAGWDIGLLQAAIPEAYGGFGDYSLVTSVLALEEFAYGDLAIALEIMVPNLVAIPVMLCGTAEQKEALLPQFMAATPPKVTAAMIEPAIQFNPRKLRTSAVAEGDGYVLNGTKTFVPLAGESDLFMVYADLSGATEAFLVPGESEGLEVSRRIKLMGLNALPAYELKLTDCRLASGARLGGRSGSDINLLLAHSRIALGAMAVGLSRAAFEYARDYAKERVQFGEPIAYRQSIAFMLADMATEIDEARLLVWEAAWLLDQDRDATAEAAIMKQQVDRMAVQVADRALQILGGYGYIREYPVELWLRNARGFAMFDGLAIV